MIRNFDLKKATNPSLTCGTVEQELWLLFMKIYSTITVKTGLIKGRCFEFVNKGKCILPYCRHLHKCSKCGNPHSAIHHRVQFPKNTQSQNKRNNNISTNHVRTFKRVIKGTNGKKRKSRTVPITVIGFKSPISLWERWDFKYPFNAKNAQGT